MELSIPLFTRKLEDTEFKYLKDKQKIKLMDNNTEIKKIDSELQKYILLFPKKHSISTLSIEIEAIIQNIYCKHIETPKEKIYPFSDGVKILLNEKIIDENLEKLLLDFWNLADFYNKNNEQELNDEKYKIVLHTGLKVIHLLGMIKYILNLNKGILPYYGLR